MPHSRDPGLQQMMSAEKLLIRGGRAVLPDRVTEPTDIVIENGLIKEMDVYKEGKIVYLIEHANVWYTCTGGVQALDTMLADLESTLIK